MRDSFALSDGVHLAEVELLGPGHRPGLPRLAAVCGTNECPARAADPNEVTVDDAQSEQASVGVRFLRVPLGESGSGDDSASCDRSKQCQNSHLFHLECLLNS